MKFINGHQPKHVKNIWPGTWFTADAYIDQEAEETRCNHCGKIFHGHQHEIRAIIHLSDQHTGARN